MEALSKQRPLPVARPPLALDGHDRPANLKDKDVKTFIDSWQVPVEIEGSKGAIAGALTWVPLDEGGLPLGAILAFAVLIIVLCVIVSSSAAGARTRRRARPKESVEAW